MFRIRDAVAPVTDAMRSFLRPLAAAFAAAYLLAGGLALALHSHAHPAKGPGGEACTVCLCGHHHHHHQSDPQSERNQASDPDREKTDHEHSEHDCVVCQYLAQPPLTAPAVTLITAEQSLTFAAAPTAPSLELVATVAWWSRGPPVG